MIPEPQCSLPGCFHSFYTGAAALEVIRRGRSCACQELERLSIGLRPDPRRGIRPAAQARKGSRSFGSFRPFARARNFAVQRSLRRVVGPPAHGPSHFVAQFLASDRRPIRSISSEQCRRIDDDMNEESRGSASDANDHAVKIICGK